MGLNVDHVNILFPLFSAIFVFIIEYFLKRLNSSDNQNGDNLSNDQNGDNLSNNQNGDNLSNNQNGDNLSNNQNGDNLSNNQNGDNLSNDQNGDNLSNDQNGDNSSRKQNYDRLRSVLSIIMWFILLIYSPAVLIYVVVEQRALTFPILLLKMLWT